MDRSQQPAAARAPKSKKHAKNAAARKTESKKAHKTAKPNAEAVLRLKTLTKLLESSVSLRQSVKTLGEMVHGDVQRARESKALLETLQDLSDGCDDVSGRVLDGTTSLLDMLRKPRARSAPRKPRSTSPRGTMLAICDMVRRRLRGKQGQMKWFPRREKTPEKDADEADLPLTALRPTNREREEPCLALADADEDDLPLAVVAKRKRVDGTAATPLHRPQDFSAELRRMIEDGRRIKTISETHTHTHPWKPNRFLQICAMSI